MRLRRLALVVPAAAVVLAACGEPSYRYVANNAEDVYLKVPREWELFRFQGEDDGRVQAEVPDDVEPVWHVAFDASEEPDPEHLASVANLPTTPAEDPLGELRIYQVQGNFNQTLSVAGARQSALGFDPLSIPDDVKDLVEIVDYQPLELGNGLQGSRVVFNVRNRDEPWQTFDVTTMFDPSAFRYYVLTVGCSAECFKANEKDIYEVTSSWKVDR
jgi:hypothetical protein